jgi:hypothetical protein
MGYNIVLTTADDIVSVVDSVNAMGGAASLDFVLKFTGIATQSQAINALDMAKDMSLLHFDSAHGTYSTSSPLARLLATATEDNQKAALMRIALEQYLPFETFKARCAITQNIDAACSQIKAIHALSSNERDIKNTIVSMATYAKILKREGASTYSFFPEESNDYLLHIDELLEEKMVSDLLLRQHLGESVYLFADYENVIRPLLDAASKSKSMPIDTKAVILYAGNAFESFLNQFAQSKGVSLVGKSGIISKLTAFPANDISKKHRGIIEFIGQIRNAADHGGDVNEGNMTWAVTRETALVYPVVVASAIKNVLQRENGVIEV